MCVCVTYNMFECAVEKYLTSTSIFQTFLENGLLCLLFQVSGKTTTFSITLASGLEDATFIFYYKQVYSHNDKSNNAKDTRTPVVSSLSRQPLPSPTQALCEAPRSVRTHHSAHLINTRTLLVFSSRFKRVNLRPYYSRRSEICFFIQG